MKVHVSVLGLILVISATSFAQRSRRTEEPPHIGFGDPFDVILQNLERPTAHWPDQQRLRERDNSHSATVSFRQLQHKVPKQAVKEYNKGRTAFRKGDKETALNHFQNAVQIDPDFADAHNDLGVLLAKVGNTGEAAEQFQRAITLAPDHTIALGNLSLALYMLKRFEEVLPIARHALRLDPGLVYVHYVLGLSLFAEHGDKKEALENLVRAAPTFPEARVFASNILVQIGRDGDAAWQLEEYLRSAPKEDTTRKEVETRLAQLRR
jgi:tetratricopeptide (TPR) repeat protein